MSSTGISIDSRLTSEFLNPEAMVTHPPSEDNVAIAPWLESNDGPPVPPKNPKPSHLSHKTSFSSFSIPRQPSSSNLFPRANGGRPSDAHSIAESSTSSSTFSDHTFHGFSTQQDLRKSKSNIFSHILQKTRSKTRLRTESEHMQYPPVPPLPAFGSTASFGSTTSLGSTTVFGSIAPSSPPLGPKKDKIRTKKKDIGKPPPPPSKDDLVLDTNIDEMEGIIDPTVLPASICEASTSSPGSGFDSHHSSSLSTSDLSFHPMGSSSGSIKFNNPDPFSSLPARRRPYLTINHRNISPKSQAPPAVQNDTATHQAEQETMESPTWTAPESWAVEKVGGDTAEPDYSSSEESLTASSKIANIPPLPGGHKRKGRRKTIGGRAPKTTGTKTFKLRIYRANNTWHVANIGLNVTVAELTPALNLKLLSDKERETHRLYLKERGRERVLAQTERPGDILRRRLEQAGYDEADGLDLLGKEDTTFLLKFVYKTQFLGPAEEDLQFTAFEYIDLTGRSLRAIPVVLHGHADTIISLNLSRNPMLEIPLDFIQSCTTLRELRLSNMAMKKVPQSVRHSVTLHRLDLSCNRISDLYDAALDRIPELSTLKIQNNRIENLPWYFPRLRTLKSINISNNKFRHLPAVICEMDGLVDLDVSFNMISELPEEIGQLKALERLVIVGNSVVKFPEECRNLISLRVLDCRRNIISDLSVVCNLPNLETLYADHNAVHALDLSIGKYMVTLEACHNDITQLTLLPSVDNRSYALTLLDISSAKLSSLADLALAHLTALETLKLDHNSFRSIPDSLGELARLTFLSCSDNQLDSLPSSIGRLQRLETLDAHGNSVTELPVSLWNCASLCHLNMTSNLLGSWHDPPIMPPFTSSMPMSTMSMSTMSMSSMSMSMTLVDSSSVRSIQFVPERKKSSSGSVISHTGRYLPPLAHSLERLYLGENRLTDDVLHPLTVLKELRVLNLSFNEIQDMPSNFFSNLVNLEELYMSGNKLSNIPTEDLPKLQQLAVLFLNGNRLQTLPVELGKVASLVVLDVGSNMLKYNINNWEFDWNWNFNQNLKYLNLSGNKRLVIKPDQSKGQQGHAAHGSGILADFSGLSQLRVLGLMDVTLAMAPIPEENSDRRVRTSPSEVNNMAYGVADNLGRNEHLNMLDLVLPEYRMRKDEAIFAMFGRAQPHASNIKLSKYLRDSFGDVFQEQLSQLDSKGGGVPDALRRAFLQLNKDWHTKLHSISSSSSSRKMSQASISTANTSLPDLSAIRSGASGIVLYIVGKTLFIANAGNALAVISKQGSAEAISRKHDPFDRMEIARIRSAEGWVSPKGLVNDEIDISRSFGFYHLVPIVNACPDVCVRELTELDEFVIIGNRGLWDYVSYQTAVDIARSERADPMIAAQKLRDFAISYGADGSTMIMVIAVADLFNCSPYRSRQPTMESLIDGDAYGSIKRRRKDDITDRNISRLDGEVSPPTGHLALVFTDIRNSTHLWEANAGMPTAMRLHNNLCRRQLRFCGGYEVKTEGDAFMCSFPTALSALWWCLTVQIQLLSEPWPLEILECEDGKELFDEEGRLIARGLSVRMGIHCGMPVCEPDPITHRMDYFGPMVNRSARITSTAAGGQILCSEDIIREINARVLETEQETEFSEYQPIQAIEAIRRIGVEVTPVGEVKLKGLEVPQLVSLVYPKELTGRQNLQEPEPDPNASASRVQFSVAQIKELGVLCLRLEALATSRIFRPAPERKSSSPPTISKFDTLQDMVSPTTAIMYGDPSLLLPPLIEKTSDAELAWILDSLTGRIENALASLHEKRSTPPASSSEVVTPTPAGQNTVSFINSLLAERARAGDDRTLQQVLALLRESIQPLSLDS